MIVEQELRLTGELLRLPRRQEQKMVCQRAGSRVALEQALDLSDAHAVEVVRNGDSSPIRKPMRRMACASGASSGTTLTSGLPALAMIERLALGRLIDKSRQLRLRVVDVHCAHCMSWT